MLKYISLLIIILVVVFSLTTNATAGYNVHQKAEAEREYKELDELCKGVSEAITNLEKRRKEMVATRNGTNLLVANAFNISCASIATTWNEESYRHIAVDISGEVADLIRDELRDILKKHLKVLEKKRDSINVD